MGQKFMLVALLFGIQLVRILLKLTVYHQIHLLTNVSVLFHAHLVSMFSGMHWKSYLHFAFPQTEVGNYLSAMKDFTTWLAIGGTQAFWFTIFFFLFSLAWPPLHSQNIN